MEAELVAYLIIVLYGKEIVSLISGYPASTAPISPLTR